MSEDLLLQNIIKTFGEDDKEGITISWGNWGQTQQMRNCIPTPGIGLRKRLARKGRSLGIRIGREHEAYTSCTCHACHGKNEYCETRTFIKNGIEQTRHIHGLLRCQNEGCSKRWNRDNNAALNIREISLATLRGDARPSHFTSGHTFTGQLNPDHD